MTRRHWIRRLIPGLVVLAASLGLVLLCGLSEGDSALAQDVASPTPTNTPSASVDLRVEPEIRNSYVGEIFALDIVAYAGSQSVDGIDAPPYFSPTEMVIIGVDNGPVLTDVRNKTVNNMTGYVRYWAQLGFDESAPNEDFLLFRLWLQSVGPAISADLVFDSLDTDATFGGVSVLRDLFNGAVFIANVTIPTSTHTPTHTGTPSRTPTPTATGTTTATGTRTATPVSTGTATSSPSATQMPSSTVTTTVTGSATHTPSTTATTTPVETATGSVTTSPTASGTASATPTPSPTGTSTATESPTPSQTASATASPSVTATPTHTATVTETATQTRRPTLTLTPTRTPTPTWLHSPTPTRTPFPTFTPTQTSTPGALKPTHGWVSFYGAIELVDGSAAPIGVVVDAYDPTGYRCGTFRVAEAGRYGPMPVYVDDPLTPERDGARGGETIRFVIDGQPAVTRGPDAPTWTISSDMWNVNLTASYLAQQDLFLKAGWNLVSFNVEPAEPAPLSVLHSIIGAFDRVLSMACDAGAQSFYPDLPLFLNTLQQMDTRHGYWIEVNQDIHVVVSGIKQPASTPLQLCRGYNLVSFLPDQPMSVQAALQSIDGLYTNVLGFDPELGAQSYYPELPPALSTLQELQSGRGYWIRMAEDGVLTYQEP